MTNETASPITRPILLLVEGADEKDICEFLLKKICSNYSDCITVEDAKGGDDLLKQVEGLDIRSGFTVLKTLAIICDAEEKPVTTAKRWRDFEQDFNNDKNKNKTCKVLILPSDTEEGAIERLFLDSLDFSENSKDFIAKCVEKFVTCVGKDSPHTTQAQCNKFKLITYINSKSKKPYTRIGIAIKDSKKDLFDFKHDSFKPLIKFLTALCPTEEKLEKP
jgi:hypothetical protein